MHAKIDFNVLIFSVVETFSLLDVHQVKRFNYLGLSIKSLVVLELTCFLLSDRNNQILHILGQN
jgi:hypothetical protein